MNLLFVCTANISRSFLAERLFKQKIEGLLLDDVFSASAGVFGMPGRTADPVMVEHLEDAGIGPVEHESTPARKRAYRLGGSNSGNGMGSSGKNRNVLA